MFLPLIIMIFANFSQPEIKKKFSFIKTSEYHFEQKTMRLNVVFYSNPGYMRLSDTERYMVMNEVENEYFEHL